MLHNVTRDEGAEASGDLLGTAAQLIEKQSPNAPVALFASGADGDQRPIFRSTPAAVGKLPSIKEGAAAWEMVDVLGSVLAKAVLATADSMQPGTGDVKISAVAKTVSCRPKNIPLVSRQRKPRPRTGLRRRFLSTSFALAISPWQE